MLYSPHIYTVEITFPMQSKSILKWIFPHYITWKTLGIGIMSLIDNIVHDIARSHSILQSLDISSNCNRLTDTAIYTITGLCPNLRSLKLKHCDGISDTAIRKIAQYHYLEHLELRSVKVLSDKSMCIIRSCPNIQYLDLQFCNITNRAVEEIALSCHKLKHLDLYGVVHISDSSISKIAKMCPSIIYLDIGHAKFISDIILKAVAEHLNSLEYLGLKNCYKISQKIVDKIFPDLEIGGYYTLPI
jgi:Leucine-rich repeat (LRR) protein